MKRIWFIRHGQHDWIGKALVGRKPGIGLNAEGWRQARAVAERLRNVRLAAIYSSPQQRALETAQPLVDSKGRALRIDHALDEIDFGEWTGRTFDELATDPRWEGWNAKRADGAVPGGEMMQDVQRRIVKAVGAIQTAEPVVFVSHGDVIKAAMIAFLGLSLNAIHTLSVEPGSMVRVEIDDVGAAQVLLDEGETFEPAEQLALS